MLLDFSEHIATRVERFTGREWVFELVDSWLAKKEPPRFFVLTGQPGDGKTAIAARLCQYSTGAAEGPRALSRLGTDFISAFHFCWARELHWINPIAFVDSLATQLANRIPEYEEILRTQRVSPALKSRGATTHVHQVVGQVINGQVIGVEVNVKAPSPQDAFVIGLREPLAALHAAGKLKPLVILVDALDESLLYDRRTGIVELLTRSEMIPPGVTFILTSRPDERVLPAFLNAGAEVHSLTSGAGLKRSREDVESYTRQLAERPEFAGKLSSGITPDSFVSAVADKSGGNFLYARYLLQMLAERATRITKQSLDGLPTGLNNLYIEFLERQVGRGWQTRYAAIAGTLAVAQEPLTERQLSGLTGKKLTSVRAARLKLLQFLKPSDDATEATRTYTIYHESFVDFLLDENAAGAFWRNPVEQHQFIADRYLKAWGGLRKNLPGLGDPARRRSDDGYGLRHLAFHLEGAGRAEELHRLLATQNQARRSAWYEAQLAEGNVAAYVADVRRAWRLAEAEAESSEGARASVALGLQVRYALTAASLRSLSVNLPPALPAALYESGIWQLSTAIDYALHAPEVMQRAKALAALAPCAAATQGRQLIAAVLEIPDLASRAHALAHAGPYLLRENADEVLEALGKLAPSSNRAYAMVNVASGLPLPLLPEAERLADELPNLNFEYSREHALSAVAERYAALGLNQEACRVARKLRIPHWRAMVWLKIALTLPVPRRAIVARSIFRRALKLNDHVFREEEMAALAALPGGLAGGERLEALRQAHALALDTQYSEVQVKNLLRLVPHVPEDARKGALREAVEQFTEWKSSASRWELMGETARELAGYLARFEGPSAALQTVSDMRWTDARMEAKSALLPQLSGAEHDETLRELRSAAEGSDPKPGLETRVKLTAHLPDETRARVLRRMLDEAWTIGDTSERAHTLAAIAPSYARLGDLEGARQALRAAQDISEPDRRDFVYGKLAEEFAASGFPAVALEAVRLLEDKHWPLRLALRRILPHLNAPFMPEAVEEARKISGGMFGMDDRDELLKLVALRWLQLGEPEQALATAHECSSDRYSQLVKRLSQLPLSPSPEQLREVLDDSDGGRYSAKGNPLMPAVEAALSLPLDERVKEAGKIAGQLQRVEQLHQRIDVIKKIAPYLSPRSRKKILEQTLAEVLGQNPIYMVRNIAALAQLLPEDEQAVTFREAMRDVRAQGLHESISLLIWEQVTPLLTLPIWKEAMTLAGAIRNDYDRDQYLSKMLPRLAELGEVESALSLAINLPRRDLRGAALASLARYLNPTQLNTALDAVRSIDDERSQTHALVVLIPRLEEARLGDALAITLSIENAGLRSEPLAKLAARLERAPHRRLLGEALRRLSNRSRENLLQDLRSLVVAIEQLGGSGAIAETSRAVRDVGFLWP